MFRTIVLLLATGVLVFTSCTPAVPQGGRGDSTSVQASKAPDWAGKTWIDGNSYFFSGISGITDNLADARQQAYLDALSKAAQYLGISLDDTTQYIINSNVSSLNSSTNITTDQTQLTQGIIKDFQYTRNKNNSIVGYLLLVYNKSDIEREKRRKEQLAQQEKRRILDRAKFRVSINTDERLDGLSAEVKEVFSKLGYQIASESDMLLNVKVADESYENVRNGMIMCVLKIEVSLGQKAQVLETFGYGKTREEAFQKAEQRLGDNLSEAIDQKIF
ncbi:MAG: hypothetical protein LBC07_00720 [Elusimicrobiota bacterium]|jgi:hypothetical protein|nr:hypothetical protein [Elusimicrobiota bacterium]